MASWCCSVEPVLGNTLGTSALVLVQHYQQSQRRLLYDELALPTDSYMCNYSMYVNNNHCHRECCQVTAQLRECVSISCTVCDERQAWLRDVAPPPSNLGSLFLMRSCTVQFESLDKSMVSTEHIIAIDE